MRTLITNGTIVTAEGSQSADVLIDGETIATIGADLAGTGVSADETIDATVASAVDAFQRDRTDPEQFFGDALQALGRVVRWR